MRRRTPHQRDLDRRADDLARAAENAQRGRKQELRFLAKQARTKALAEGPVARLDPLHLGRRAWGAA